MFIRLTIDKVERLYRSGDEARFFVRIRNFFINRYTWHITLHKSYKKPQPKIQERIDDQKAMASGSWAPEQGFMLESGYAPTRKGALKRAAQAWAEQFEQRDITYLAMDPEFRPISDEELGYELMKDPEVTANK